SAPVSTPVAEQPMTAAPGIVRRTAESTPAYSSSSRLMPANTIATYAARVSAAASARCAARPAAVNPSRWTATPTPAEVIAPLYRGRRKRQRRFCGWDVDATAPSLSCRVVIRYTDDDPEITRGRNGFDGGLQSSGRVSRRPRPRKNGQKKNSERQRVRSRHLNSGRDHEPGSRPRPRQVAI